MPKLQHWWRRLFGRPLAPPADEYERAAVLLHAIDRGGVPLNPARLNQIARDLGLEVSRQARPEETIERIRAAMARRPH